ncbi:3-oxoadipate enol-lactonase 2 [Colletotrichum truncatum]|uniref:3-oxoadipate enol-lactonase 2 n=1 Tax=Colletotrichum truncatum TaxID=5467 RepID=A0ACC3Z855_COLTU|nr:3-oxoadipate enol-lactonase 2 [Colletotrichum truncatum]KAF6783636.1 3-oxoadipate enol-lactonase 2 [Colletotrichum truncatum]
MANPGMLYVTMQPKPELAIEQFHEWYNNEHGPTRLRLPQIFTNGLRYQANDGQEPTFLATYDVTSMSHLETPTYTTLRANRSSREAETIGQVDVTRYFFDLVIERKAPLFLPIEQLSDKEAEGLELVAVQTTLHDESGEAELKKWYEEEHIDMLSKVPGWLRTRVVKVSSLGDGAGSKTTFFALHDYARQNGLGGPEHKASMSTKWGGEIVSKYVKDKSRRTYKLFYVFGPAPRDLSNLAKLPASTASWTSPDGKTKTVPGPNEVISSYITAEDNLSIPYRLEGNPSPDAPTVAFSNSLLTSLHMWDSLVEIIKQKRPDLRILRYDTRGRHAIPNPPVPATLDLLASDLRTVLDALRIPKLHALIGVSMGGATTTNFALKYPNRLKKFIACDFNVTSSAANTQAWKDRIAVAEEDSGAGIAKLAQQTVGRWFHPATMEKENLVKSMTDMVATNDVVGFKYSCQALWDYDLKPALSSCQVPGLLVVGDGDGKGALVKAMDGFKGLVGENGVELKIVPNAGHLPMWEDHAAFWEAIQEFL